MSQDHTNQQELHQQDQDNQGEYDDQQQYEDNQGQEHNGVDVDEQIAEAQEDRDENGQEVDEEENQNGEEGQEGEGEYDADGQEHHDHDQQQDEGAYDYDANGEEHEERQEGYEDTYQYNSQKQHEDEEGEREYQHGRQEEGEIPSEIAQQEHDALHEILQFPEGSTQYTYLQQQQNTQSAQKVPYTFQENGIEYEAVEQTVIEYQPVERKITVMVPKKKPVSSVDLTNTLVHSQIRTFPTTGLYQPPPFLASSQIRLNPAVQPLQPYQTRVGNVLYQSQIVLQAPQTNFQQPRSTTFIQPSVGQIGGSRIYTQPLNIPRPVNVTTGVASTSSATTTASVPSGFQTQIIRQQVPQQVQFQRQIIRSGQPILQLKQQPQQVQFKPIATQQPQQHQQSQQPQQIQQQLQQQQQFVLTNNTQVFRPPFPISNATSVQQPSFVKAPQVIQTPFLQQSRIVRQPFGTTFATNPGFQSRSVFLPPNQTQRIVNSPWQFQTQNSNATTIKK